MSRINSGMVLPGGWHYKDPTGYRIPYSSELPNPQAVIDAIMEYRLENKLPVGDPAADMENYVCANFQSWCRGATNNEYLNHPNVSAPPTLRWVDVIGAWANRFYEIAASLRLVPMRDAEARSEVCRACPMQKEWEGDCPPCVESANRVLKILRQGREVVHWKRLKSCSVQGFCTRTAVHFERDQLGPVSDAAPPPCWLRNEK